MKYTYSTEFIPSFGFTGIPNQRLVCRLTVLSIGTSGRDCAAYEGIVHENLAESEIAHDLVKRQGNKVSEERARSLFNLGQLKYRG